ncbi:MAG: ADP-ribosylglycohydrolase family protein [Anaerolineaceae bacterium]|nr:ADP-ribosylglycohydrolase family protein [Anaerolineaceae bacterium]
MEKIERAKGCMVGLACGDALGDVGRSDLFRKRYGIITNFYGDARSTDDTEFAVLSARILLDCKGQLTRQAVLDGWKKYILDQGGLFDRGGAPLYGAVANLNRGMLPPQSGRFNVNNDDDGAAMRAAPFGVYAAGDPDKAAALAELDAEVSHYTDGIWAAQAVAAAVSLAMVGASVDAIWEQAISRIPEDSWLGYAMQLADKICTDAGTIEDAWEDLHNVFWTPSHAQSAEAMPQIFSIFRLTGGDFKKGMFWACNFGRDADTIGAVVGALGGAIHGLQAIPDNWVERVRKPSGICIKAAAQEDMLELATDLCQLPG